MNTEQRKQAKKILAKHYPIKMAHIDDTLDDLIAAMEEYANLPRIEITEEEPDFKNCTNDLVAGSGFCKLGLPCKDCRFYRNPNNQ
jgi:hypothetical protein